jgi:hypothetical protein
MTGVIFRFLDSVRQAFFLKNMINALTSATIGPA